MSVLRFVLPSSQSRERLDKVLSELVPETSRATLQRWIEEGRVTVDGGACRARDRVKPGQTLEIVPAAPPATRALRDPSVRFDVLFEDDYLVVVNKPAGLVVHPAKGHADGTLVNGLVARYDWDWPEDDPSQDPAVIRPGIVHRIDKDTSGILVVARTEQAREGLKLQLQNHQMGRKYFAITLGTPRASTIRTAYGRHPRSRLKFTSRVREGKSAITHVSLVETLAGGAAALVECRLETGRTHQIRVHLSEQAMTPLLGDTLYGRRVDTPVILEAERLIGRQALHAAELAFRHPVSSVPLAFRVAPPEDFAQALEYLRGCRSGG